jgi:energy-converting hydrogenase Eha subunit E
VKYLPDSAEVFAMVGIDVPTLALSIAELPYENIIQLVQYIDADVADTVFTRQLKAAVDEMDSGEDEEAQSG